MKYTFKLSALLLSILATAPTLGSAETLYTLSNDVVDNAVYVYNRTNTGDIKLLNHYTTGGEGTGAGLGNQAPLAMSANDRYLFAVNAGSNEVSVFQVLSNGLKLLSYAAETTGIRPVSIDVHDNLVYVVNAGDDSIFGFKFDPATGTLMPMPNSYKSLSATGGTTGAAEIKFNSTGDALIVTEKATNKISSFHLNEQGIPDASYVAASAGSTPFGFSFGKRDQVFISEAQGGGANPKASTVSSYWVKPDGSLGLIAGQVASLQTAACWLISTPDGRMVFTADTPDNTISSYKVDFNGKPYLKLSSAATEMKPNELAVSPDGEILFSLNKGDLTLSSYKITTTGTLVKQKIATGVPAFATGLIVR
jgi:6-phosphogluconolactonase (cycloisomerase 2 family)